MTPQPIFNVEAEQAVLGAVLLTGRPALDALTLDLGLRPEHFYRQPHATIYEAMRRTADQGGEIDSLTVTAQLQQDGKLGEAGGAAMVDALCGSAPAAGNFREYAQIVLSRARWEARRRAWMRAGAALASLDENGWSGAEGEMHAPSQTSQQLWTGERQADDLYRWLADRTIDEKILLPFEGLNDALCGGLALGAVSVFGTWQNWGKSALTSQCLRFAAVLGHKTCMYSNEMTHRQYSQRALAALSMVPYSKLADRRKHDRLTPDEHRRLVAAMPRLRVAIQPVHGWGALDIARHIRRSRWDLWAVDYVHNIPYKGVDELNFIITTLASVAGETESHGVLVSQLNQERNKGAELPRPVRRDLRGTGMLQDAPANILMIAREQEEVTIDGRGSGVFRPLPDSTIYLEKARDGELAAVSAWFDKRRMVFEEEEA